jgi:hypothetical protein
LIKYDTGNRQLVKRTLPGLGARKRVVVITADIFDEVPSEEADLDERERERYSAVSAD